ncbi:MAG: YceI family protein [Mariniblastus sp.]|nr:YceI family protein [Mariniblastus sp.]
MHLRKNPLYWTLAVVLTLPASWLPGQTSDDAPATNAVPLRSAALLAPSNSSISFVGIHVGDDPKPRLGGFQNFHGHIAVDASGESLESIAVDIDVESIWTQFEKLTNHLKNEDFFETNRFPSARFVSTKIEQETSGSSVKGWITGNLTLHGQTREIRFPFEAKLGSAGKPADGGLQMTSQFKIDRSEFGMDQMLSGVDKMVEIEIAVGKPTRASAAQPGHGGGKKKQTRQDSAGKMQVVSLYLPHMT